MEEKAELRSCEFTLLVGKDRKGTALSEQEVTGNTECLFVYYLWSRLFREVLGSPFLDTFKVRLDGALNNNNLLESLLIAGWVGIDEF